MFYKLYHKNIDGKKTLEKLGELATAICQDFLLIFTISIIFLMQMDFNLPKFFPLNFCSPYSPKFFTTNFLLYGICVVID